MLGIFLFVFCRAPQELVNFPSGLHGYWQDTPPAAAVAQDVKTAEVYLDCLTNSAVSTTTQCTIGSYGQVSGQDYQGGALLTVLGYKIFVANVLFAAVSEYHINSLIASYNLLAGKASSLAISARSSSSPAASTSTLSPTASGGQPTTSGPVTVPPPTIITMAADPTTVGGAPQQPLNPIGSGSATLQPSPDPTSVPAIILPPSTPTSTLSPTASGGQPATIPQQAPDPATSSPAIAPPPLSTSNPQSAAPVTVQPTTNANTPSPATDSTTSGTPLPPASGKGQPTTNAPDPAVAAAARSAQEAVDQKAQAEAARKAQEAADQKAQAEAARKNDETFFAIGQMPAGTNRNRFATSDAAKNDFLSRFYKLTPTDQEKFKKEWTVKSTSKYIGLGSSKTAKIIEQYSQMLPGKRAELFSKGPIEFKWTIQDTRT